MAVNQSLSALLPVEVLFLVCMVKKQLQTFFLERFKELAKGNTCSKKTIARLLIELTY